MIIDPPITEEERLELFAINGGGIPKMSIFGLRLLKKLKEEKPMTAEELSAMWKELRPQIGNFMCQLDSEVRFIQDRHDTYVTKEEHERKCDECYDAGIDIGRKSRELDYGWLIYQLDEMKEDELVKLFGTDCPFDVLKMSWTNGIEEILDKIYDHATQKEVAEEWQRRKIREVLQEMNCCANDVETVREAARRMMAAAEAERESFKSELNEWYKSHLEEIKQAEAPLADELEKLAIKRMFLETQFKERKRALDMEKDE